jgi:hypothetical protein
MKTVHADLEESGIMYLSKAGGCQALSVIVGGVVFWAFGGAEDSL